MSPSPHVAWSYCSTHEAPTDALDRLAMQPIVVALIGQHV
jgi:hypothetical protein